jgi:hypothetical protein
MTDGRVLPANHVRLPKIAPKQPLQCARRGDLKTAASFDYNPALVA